MPLRGPSHDTVGAHGVRARLALGPLFLCAALARCTPGQQGTGDGFTADASDDVAQDAPPEAAFFDPGPSPACSEPGSARHVIDRPGGDRVAEPAALVAVSDGFLATARRTDNAAPLPDGTLPPPLRDSVELFALGQDGAPRGQRNAYDARTAGTQVDTPLLFAREGGAIVLFQESRSNASAADFLLQLRGGAVDGAGTGAEPAVLRERYPRPTMTRLNDGTLLGVTSRVAAVTPTGMVTTEPVAMHLRPDGTNVAPDASINAFLPFDVLDAVLRASDDGGARLAYRLNGRLGFLRFRPDGAVDARGPIEVRGSEVPDIDDAVAAGDGLVVVGARAAGDSAEVRVTVAGDQGDLRLSRVLETVPLSEGLPAPTAYRGYGGAVLLWTRGATANAKIRVAVVAPDGRVLLEPRDLVSSPDSYGRVAAVVNGRSVSLLVRDGVIPSRWGYSFARACVPSF